MRSAPMKPASSSHQKIPKALASAMNHLLSKRAPCANAWDTAGRKWAAQFTWDRTAQAQEEVYLKVAHITTAMKKPSGSRL